MNDFDANEIFAQLADANADWAQAAAKDAIPAPKIVVKDTGLSYLGDQEDGLGVMHSVYVYAYEGKRLFNVWVDLSTKMDAPKSSKFLHLHPIRIVSIDGKTSIDTAGVAGVCVHPDGSGTHVDGRTVASFVRPRAMRYLLKLSDS